MSESGTPEATHFRCAYHGEVLPEDEYQQHCDEKHGGNLIAVQFVAPESGTPEAILSEEKIEQYVIALRARPTGEWRDAAAALVASHEALRRLVERLTAERDELRQSVSEGHEALTAALQTRHMRAEAAEARLADLEAALKRIKERRRVSSDTYRGDIQWPTDAAKHWHDGYVTALATCSLIADEALDPEAWAENERLQRVASFGTDREWFEATGNCGHCGNLAEDCLCTDDDPCGCGPHPERRTWPRDCGWCKGTGKVEPPAARALLVPEKKDEG